MREGRRPAGRMRRLMTSEARDRNAQLNAIALVASALMAALVGWVTSSMDPASRVGAVVGTLLAGLLLGGWIASVASRSAEPQT